MFISAYDLKRALLNGKVFFELSAIILDAENKNDYQHIYCLCLYILVDNSERPIKIVSNQSENDYSLYFEAIEKEEYDVRFNSGGLSENMTSYTFDTVEHKAVRDCYICEDEGDIVSLNLQFDDNSIMHIVSGEHYKANEGYDISSPDEMILVFTSTFEAQKYNLSIHAFESK